MTLSEIHAGAGLLGGAAFLAYWALWSHKDRVSMAGSVAKTAPVAVMAAIAGNAGVLPIAMGLALGALGDFALSRPGKPAFLAGMAFFAAGHLMYADAFRGADGGLTLWQGTGLLGLLALLILTGIWLGPRTGALRLPVRGYVVVIALMAAAAATLPPGDGRGVIWGGVGLFVLSDLLLALRLFAVTAPPWQRALSRVLWPAYALGQALILLGSLTYWPTAHG